MNNKIKGSIVGAIIGAGLVLTFEGNFKQFIGFSASIGATGYAVVALTEFCGFTDG